MEMLPQVAAAELSGKPPGDTLPHHGSVGSEADQNSHLNASQRITPEDEVTYDSTGAGRKEDEPGKLSPSIEEVTLNLGLEEAASSSQRKNTFTLNCHHQNFPLCDCVAKATKPRPTHGRLGRRSGRRNHRGPTLAALRDVGLEVFDENEESDFQESETETENQQADTTDAESDCTAGLESDVEGAVGGEDPKQLAPPGTSGVRRASIVTADSRRDEILPSPEPVKVAVFGTDGVGKSGKYLSPFFLISLRENTPDPLCALAPHPRRQSDLQAESLPKLPARRRDGLTAASTLRYNFLRNRKTLPLLGGRWHGPLLLAAAQLFWT